MSTESQAAASRANSLHSTGPKTLEGKAKMFANPLRHGLTSAHLIIPGESEQHFLDLLQTLTQRYAPLGYTETTCVQQIAEAQWRLLRLRRAETALFTRHMEELLEEAEGDHDLALALVHERHHANIARFHRYETTLNRQINKAEREIARVQKERWEDEVVQHVALRAGSASQKPLIEQSGITQTEPSPAAAAAVPPVGSAAQNQPANPPQHKMTRKERRTLRRLEAQNRVTA